MIPMSFGWLEQCAKLQRSGGKMEGFIFLFKIHLGQSTQVLYVKLN